MTDELLIRLFLCFFASGVVAIFLNKKIKFVSLLGFSIVWGLLSWLLVLLLNTRIALDYLHTFLIALLYALFMYKSYISNYILEKFNKTE